MKRMGFQLKLSLIFIFITVFILTVTTYFIYRKAISQQKEDLRGKILSLAKIAGILIDTDKLIQVKPVLASQNTGLYQEIKAVLYKIRKVDPIIDSVYTMVKSDKENVWIFLVDSGDKRGVIAYCGERYDVSHLPEMKLAFSRPSVDRQVNTDKWGTFLSGYAPLYNKEGQAVAIVGLDVRAESILKMQLLLGEKFLWVLIIGILFSLLTGSIVARNITYPLYRLALGVKEVGQGNLEKKVSIKTGDEIEELASAFNKMTGQLLESQNRLHRYYLDTIHSLARAIEAKDPYTRGHSERVTKYAVNLAKHLGLSEGDVKLLKEVCILHDIGKIGVPEEILTKPGSLSEEEWHIVKRHPEVGEEILKFFEFLKPGLTIVRDHHERPDGKGYPRGLRTDKISQLASIVAVADAFDAMTSERSYRKAFSQEEAIRILEENKDKQFDGRIVDIFIATLNRDGS